MEFLDFRHGKGAIELDFDFKSLLKPIKDEKFIQANLVDLDDETIDRVIFSPKVMLGEVFIEDSVIDINYDFGTLNKDKGFTYYYDLCSKNLMFFAIKNQVNGKTIIEICATSTFVNKTGGYSCSLYYLPKGDFSNIALISRICDHRGTNNHVNSDGTVIGDDQLHIHKQSEKYISYVKDKYANDKQKMLLALQSPDAQAIYYDCENVKQLTDLACEMFSISVVNQLSFLVEDKKQVYTEIDRGMEEFAL